MGRIKSIYMGKNVFDAYTSVFPEPHNVGFARYEWAGIPVHLLKTEMNANKIVIKYKTKLRPKKFTFYKKITFNPLADFIGRIV